MSTGVQCLGRTKPGLTGKDCDGYGARPETRLCSGCTHEAKQLGLEIRHFTLAEQLAFSRPKRRMWRELDQRDVELGG